MLVEKRKKIVAEIPTASLADIAFLLLIFFLVITKIGTDKGIDLVLPAEGGVVCLPPGRYLLRRSAELRSNVRLRGEGPATVVMRPAPVDA